MGEVVGYLDHFGVHWFSGRNGVEGCRAEKELGVLRLVRLTPPFAQDDKSTPGPISGTQASTRSHEGCVWNNLVTEELGGGVGRDGR